MFQQNHGCLTSASQGATVEIVSIGGGMRLHSRLVGMGLLAGTRVEVRRNDGWGPVLLALGQARIAIGRGTAEQVRVCPVPATSARGPEAVGTV